MPKASLELDRREGEQMSCRARGLAPSPQLAQPVLHHELPSPNKTKHFKALSILMHITECKAALGHLGLCKNCICAQLFEHRS